MHDSCEEPTFKRPTPDGSPAATYRIWSPPGDQASTSPQSSHTCAGAPPLASTTKMGILPCSSKRVRDLRSITTDRRIVILRHSRQDGLGARRRASSARRRIDPLAASGTPTWPRRLTASGRNHLRRPRVTRFSGPSSRAAVCVDRQAPDVGPHRPADEHHSSVRGDRGGRFVCRAERRPLRHCR